MYREFKISGMACASCQHNIQKNVSKIQGVRNVNVNLISAIMTLECDDNITAQAIIDTVNQIGYGATECNHHNFTTDNHRPVKKNSLN
ncbi:MAG: heavy-metal-associated domain-containing protein [Clostridia bacterium]|nr:heavy-metal-associated domain-containing protein [Clostridia bacterium]